MIIRGITGSQYTGNTERMNIRTGNEYTGNTWNK